MKLLKISLIFSFCICVFAQAQDKLRPNILMLVCEDMSPHLGCYGDSLVKTPNIDRLAKEGIRYTRMFSTAGVCAPSRSTLITGMYQTSIGTHNMRTQGEASKPVNLKSYSRVLPENVKCYSEYLRAAGYYCTNNEKTDYQFEPPVTAWDESSKKAHWRNRPDKSQPFFSIFNFNVTHESQVWARSGEPLEVDPAKVSVPPYYPESPIVRNDVARFLSNVNEMDRQVGKIIKQLEEDGLLSSTTIIFYSDHGDGLPFVKREVTNRGIHVPFIVRNGNKAGAGTVDTVLHSFVDMAPSMLSLAGVVVPGYMQGQAFLGSQASKKARQYIFAGRDRLDTEYDRVRSVRDRRYQYLRNYFPEKPYYMNVKYRQQQPMMVEMLKLKTEGKLNDLQMRWFLPKGVTEELYDLENDPHQFNNLAKVPAYSSKLKELSEAMNNWISTVGDMGAVEESKMVEEQWPGGVQPVTAAPTLVFKNGKSTLNCSTAGASIAYKIFDKNSQEPARWQLYTGPFVKKDTQQVKAVAIRIGYTESEIFVF
jgi:arylsulfatase A-like enzyme